MEQLINISQLRNLWLRSPDERLARWRELRLDLQSKYADCNANPLPLLGTVSTWWSMVPLVSVSMDPYDLSVWPSVWEIVDNGECCKYSKGLAMGYTLHYIDQHADVTVARVLDTYHNDEYFVAIWNDQYVLNSYFGDVVDIHEVDSYLKVQESWTMQDIVHGHQKQK